MMMTFEKGETVRIVWGGTVTSGGIVLKKKLGGKYRVRHHHGREEILHERNLRKCW